MFKKSSHWEEITKHWIETLEITFTLKPTDLSERLQVKQQSDTHKCDKSDL